ncbi:hypothetical protein F511_25627 [Dorcoceras hygrometricum]|uniref:Uncharacterized protein n=1 Tax=Dorcoceras hygrometricum TaxID=472368 RepID=A0A2Z7AHM6_9LAMI|nr:hypothetical protein F511_25627 [Dorcoceras hygrometricum]
MGNADPNNTKAGKEYEVKPQTSVIKACESAGSNLNRASIPAQCINRGNHRSVIIRPVSHNNSAVFRHNQSVGHHSDDSIETFRHDTSVCRSQRGSISDLTRYGSFNCSNYFLTGHITHNRMNCPGAKSVKASQYSAQILASTTYCLRSRTQIWFYLSQQLLTARTKLKTARNTYPEAHTHRRTLYSTVAKTHQLTASSRSLSNIEPGFLTGINRKSYSR